jgi:hypothetical protein
MGRPQSWFFVAIPPTVRWETGPRLSLPRASSSLGDLSRMNVWHVDGLDVLRRVTGLRRDVRLRSSAMSVYPMFTTR